MELTIPLNEMKLVPNPNLPKDVFLVVPRNSFVNQQEEEAQQEEEENGLEARRRASTNMQRESAKVADFEVAVIGAIKVKTTGLMGMNKDYTAFRLIVRDSQKATWFLDKRYSDFENLHSECSDLTSLNLPVKERFKMNRGSDEAFIMKRRSALQEYMTVLLRSDKAQKYRSIRAFLEKGQHMTSEADILQEWMVCSELVETWKQQEKESAYRKSMIMNAGPIEICLRFETHDQSSTWSALLGAAKQRDPHDLRWSM